MMSSRLRLIDEFASEVRARGLPDLGKVETCGLFGDLCWRPHGDADYLWSRRAKDPAFTIEGYARMIALARILDDIRYYAAPIVEGAPSWWWSGADPDRVAAVRAEPYEYELGRFSTIADAVRFAHSYLAGVPFGSLDVPRWRPAGSRYELSRPLR